MGRRDAESRSEPGVVGRAGEALDAFDERRQFVRFHAIKDIRIRADQALEDGQRVLVGQAPLFLVHETRDVAVGVVVQHGEIKLYAAFIDDKHGDLMYVRRGPPTQITTVALSW